MQKIETMIKVHKWNLDEKRQQLHDLKKLLEQFEQQEQKLNEEFEKEKEALKKQGDVKADFVNYKKLIESRKKTLHDSMDSVEEQIKVAEKEMLDAFQKLKKFELIRDNAQQKSRKKRELKFQKQLDEVGINQYTQKDRRT